MEDDLYIKAYQKYRETLKSSDFYKSLLPPTLYNTIEAPKSNLGIIWIYKEVFSEYNRQLTNDINTFRRNLIKLNSWNIILKEYEDDVKFELILEFIEPLIVLLHDFPYSIKNRFIFSLSNLCHQANRYIVDNWTDDIVDDRKINFKIMDKKCSNCKYFDKFKLELSNIFSDEYNIKTNNYRNMSHHRIPLNTEIGLSNFVTRNKDKNGKVSYSFGNTKPISLEKTINIMKEQHLIMCKCFEAYEVLLEHQVNKINEKMVED